MSGRISRVIQFCRRYLSTVFCGQLAVDRCFSFGGRNLRRSFQEKPAGKTGPTVDNFSGNLGEVFVGKTVAASVYSFGLQLRFTASFRVCLVYIQSVGRLGISKVLSRSG